MAMRILLSKARENFSDTVNRVAYGDERILLQRNGKDFVAVVPVGDLKKLEELEDRLDVAAARKARAERSIPWEQAKHFLARKRPRKSARRAS